MRQSETFNRDMSLVPMPTRRSSKAVNGLPAGCAMEST